MRIGGRFRLITSSQLMYLWAEMVRWGTETVLWGKGWEENITCFCTYMLSTELIYSLGLYVGRRVGRENIIRLWTAEGRIWSVALHNRTPLLHSNCTTLYHYFILGWLVSTLLSPAPYCIVPGLHATMAALATQNNLYIISPENMSAPLYSHDYQPGFSRLLMQQFSQSNVPKCLGG